MSDADRAPWERRPRESAAAYKGFRAYRDLGPTRSLDAVVEQLAVFSRRTITTWSASHVWRSRARAWDDHVYRIEDAERLSALAAMHRNHALAGRVALTKALAALQRLTAEDIPPAAAVRLLDVGTRLERSTLVTSVAELQGATPEEPDDPWAAIAAELQGGGVS